jgi:hypothetical protein
VSGVTERAAHRIVVELTAAGYITPERRGRRNRYTINTHLPVHDPVGGEQNVGQLLEILTANPSFRRTGRSREDERERVIRASSRRSVAPEHAALINLRGHTVPRAARVQTLRRLQSSGSL